MNEFSLKYEKIPAIYKLCLGEITPKKLILKPRILVLCFKHQLEV